MVSKVSPSSIRDSTPSAHFWAFLRVLKVFVRAGRPALWTVAVKLPLLSRMLAMEQQGYYNYSKCVKSATHALGETKESSNTLILLEAGVGIEPAYTELQSAA